jgi:hypothetical protein
MTTTETDEKFLMDGPFAHYLGKGGLWQGPTATSTPIFGLEANHAAYLSKPFDIVVFKTPKH